MTKGRGMVLIDRARRKTAPAVAMAVQCAVVPLFFPETQGVALDDLHARMEMPA